MSDVTEVTPEQFDRMCALLTEGRNLHEKARNPGLTLAQKLAYQKQAKDLYNQARSIGKESV
jgi:hypothetical protein